MSNTELATVDRVQRGLANMEKQFKSTLPAHIEPKKFLRAAVTAVQNTPDLQKAEYNSVIASCQKAATDGLLIDNKEAALVVFNQKAGNTWIKVAQYMPMVNGILKKMRQSGQISTITAKVVYTNDKFEYWEDETGTHFKHVPELDEDPGEMRLAYARAVLKDGSHQLEIMRKADIEKVRKVSKSGSDDKGNAKGIWQQWPEEMWKKTVLRKIAKYLPSSTDLEQTFQFDNENYDLGDMPEQEAAVESSKQKNPAKETKASQAIKSKAAKVATSQAVNGSDVVDGEFAEIPEDFHPNTEAGDPGPGSEEIPI